VTRSGAPTLSFQGADELRVGVVAARWHEQVMTGLLDGALRALAQARVDDPLVLRVPGSFELPVACARLARARYDVLVALGVVIRGDTPHFDYVCRAATCPAPPRTRVTKPPRPPWPRCSLSAAATPEPAP
jgi:6,7-dimethyl-8-ribityllumazine synthase